MKNLLYFLFAILFYGHLSAQATTAIPDTIFEHILIDKGIDSDGVVNGQVLTSDIENLTKLSIYGYDYPQYQGPNPEDGFIHSLAGIEDFINLDTLIINSTYITHLDLQNLSQLLYLDCFDNLLTDIDLSGNPQLVELITSNYGDMLPFNTIDELDLSHNPNIKDITAYNIDKINLKNGNNNPNMHINVEAIQMGGPDPGLIVCVVVDDAEAAQNNAFPYSQWTIESSYPPINFIDNMDQCGLATDSFVKNTIKVYPNPTKDKLNFSGIDQALSVSVYDLSGKIVLSTAMNAQKTQIDVGNLKSGVYFYKLSTQNGLYAKGRFIKVD